MRVPTVSIGLPVYNGEKYLALALESVARQEFSDFELLISDNASSDATEEICRSAAAKDPRIRYFRNDSNLGAQANYNRVFALSRGEYFKWAAHDDEFAPTLLRRCLETFRQSSPDTTLVFSLADIIDEAGRRKFQSMDTINPNRGRPAGRFASLIFYRCYAHPLWGLIRAQALRRTRGIGWIEADHVLLAELALLGPIVEIPEVLYSLRLHPGSAQALHPDRRSLLHWYAPDRSTRRLVLPHWLLWDMEYIKAIRFLALTPTDRLGCYCALRSVPGWRRLLYLTGSWRRRMGLHRRRRPAPGLTISR